MESTAERTLDTDHAMALATIVLGVASLLLLAVSTAAAVWTGLPAVLLGGWSQLLSRTRAERFENVIGATAGALAVAIGLAKGGLL